MDILDIDAVNFAGRVGHVAAAEICGLLTSGEISPIGDWFLREPAEPGTDLQPQLDQMAAYVVRRQCGGETLFRHLDIGEWDEAPPPTAMAFKVFASTTYSVADKLLRDQVDAEQALELATRPTPAPAALEDTIFKPVDGLGALRPEAELSAKQVAERDRLLKAEARARRKAEEAAAKKAKADADLEAAQQATAAIRAATGAPISIVEGDGAAAALEAQGRPALSVGEAPPARPVNRGGRGNKKTM